MYQLVRRFNKEAAIATHRYDEGYRHSFTFKIKLVYKGKLEN